MPFCLMGRLELANGISGSCVQPSLQMHRSRLLSSLAVRLFNSKNWGIPNVGIYLNIDAKLLGYKGLCRFLVYRCVFVRVGGGAVLKM